jgi:DNA-binding transcriptional ArsR family regulator
MAGTSRAFDSDPGKQRAGKAPGEDIGQRLLKVLSHPIRIEVLRELQNRVASPKELADELGEPLSTVSYHFKYLRLEGCIEILDTQPRRGAVEHFYRAKTPPTQGGKDWTRLSSAARGEVSAVVIRDLLAEAVRALDAGTFDAREDRRLSWMPMELDEEGWQELSELQAEWFAELGRIRAEAAERLAEEGGARRRVVAGVMGFETPPGPGFANRTTKR